MADITKVRAAADVVKAQLNEKLKKDIAALTSADIDEVVSLLEKTGINRAEVQNLKAKITRSTNKNQTIARVLDTPGVLCEQVKSIIGKIVK
ncbi:MAG: hypothetical protein K2G93_07455 [Rikenella sp.]|nr:hypothetical protein [Rikenella sp.]